MRTKTVKQIAWINAMLEGCNQTEAARIAKYAKGTEKFRGHENATNSNLMKEIEAKRAELALKTEYTVKAAEQEYEEARVLAIQLNQPGAAVAAVTGKARLYGMDKDNVRERQERISINVTKRLD